MHPTLPHKKMTFLPSLTTTTSISVSQARNRALNLYRQWLKAAPEIVDLYKLEVDEFAFRRRIRQEFEKNRYVNDIQIVDILLFKGRTELEETLNAWKQPTHVMRYFVSDPYAKPRKADFLSNFYNGS
jgi:NADH dehydrogenase (ubiquinone) 1 alpha subcomplex subunit 6